MSIFLLILKIAGIVLLALILLILLIAALILFVPVRYRVQAEGAFHEAFSGGDGNADSADQRNQAGNHVMISARWLLSLVTIRFCPDQDKKNGIQILGILLYPRRKKKSEKARKSRKNRKDRENRETDRQAGITNTAHKKKPENDAACDSDGKSPEHDGPWGSDEHESDRDAARTTEKNPKERTAQASDEAISKKKRPSHREGFLAGIRRIRESLHTMREKYTDWRSRIRAIREALADEEKKEALRIIVRESLSLSKSILPKKIDGDARFSLGDPARTGQALGAAAMIPAIYRYQIQISPDFASEQIYAEGTLDARGRLYGVTLLHLLFRLMREKSIRNIMSARE